MRLRVNHATTYTYDRPAEGVVQVLRQTPAAFDGLSVVSWRVEVDADGYLRERIDPFGNLTHTFYAEGPVEALTVRASGEAFTEDRAGVVIGAPDLLPLGVYLRPTALTRPDLGIDQLARSCARAERLPTLHALMSTLYGQMQFDTAASVVTTTGAQALSAGRGVCQDYAHIFVSAARLLGIPARYVSGHLARRDAPSQEAAHAWAEAYVPDLGWVGFDAANGVCPGEMHLRVAVGLDYLDAAPLRGARRGGGEERLSVVVSAIDRTFQAQQ